MTEEIKSASDAVESARAARDAATKAVNDAVAHRNAVNAELNHAIAAFNTALTLKPAPTRTRT